jgi:hypothetical protein
MDPLKKRRAIWGVLLSWTPWLPTIIGLGSAFRGIAKEKATGLAAVAGGLTETFLLFGLLATVVFEVAAIILLVRAFEPGHWLRSLFLAFSLCLSGLMLLLFGAFLWSSWFQMHHSM